MRPVNPATGGSPGRVASAARAAARRASRADRLLLCGNPRTGPTSSPRSSASTSTRAARTTSPTASRGTRSCRTSRSKTEHAQHADGSRANWYNPSNNTIASSINIFLPGRATRTTRSSRQQPGRAAVLRRRRAGRPRRQHHETDTQRYLLGLKGTNGGWDWDVAGLYIRSDTDDTRTNFYSYDRLQQGLAGTGPYGYYRIGANANLNNPAIYDWIAPDRPWSISSENTIFDAKASRDIYKLDGGQTGAGRRLPVREGGAVQPGHARHGYGQRRGPRLLGGVRLAQHQRAVRRIVCARYSRTSS